MTRIIKVGDYVRIISLMPPEELEWGIVQEISDDTWNGDWYAIVSMKNTELEVNKRLRLVHCRKITEEELFKLLIEQ